MDALCFNLNQNGYSASDRPEIKVGEKDQLRVDRKNRDCEKYGYYMSFLLSSFTWKSSNSSVTTVTKNKSGSGTIRGVKAGKAVVTCTMKSGLKKQIPVTVK